MDSASPIDQRIAGETALDTGITFTFSMGFNKAENTLKRGFCGRPRGYRHIHHRSYGEGLPA
ncbi:uncharacterized protein NP_3381D [Natronomonas pharaonis DSM 2160]|uniref:Uncharacterized protein n=1 Tax=Natronomonas pharaonis (strain ATCC 35678 / DSM 2160 / CIP 103997 / JCM 8858 / NBRC 14720 / NCIMB 2260 / Gabara) TaxID=348780 RepID=A0A1U7EZP5_NATPD|nr:hypothetical protein [Natronomonas pharaonis]CCI69581.1 uncharacterized protein NP_3381D [Natronomonas pharaonis DSM 2160]